MSVEESITDEPDAEDKPNNKKDKGISLAEYLSDEDEKVLIDNFPPITDADFQIIGHQEVPKEDEETPLEEYLKDEDEKEETLIDNFPQITDADRQIIEYKDAVSESAKILAPQLGSDKAMLEKGKIDIRRLSNIDKVERLWISFFNRTPKDQGGEWMEDFTDDYLNLSPSLGGMRAKLIILMQSAIGGTRQQRTKAQDDRSFIEKHFTKRNQKPGDVLDVGI